MNHWINRFWTHWSESESEISYTDYIDLYCGNPDQRRKRKPRAFARSALTFTDIKTYATSIETISNKHVCSKMFSHPNPFNTFQCMLVQKYLVPLP